MLLPPWFSSYVRSLAINKSGCVSCVIVTVQGVRNHACVFWHTVKSTGLLLKVYFHWLLTQVTTGGKAQCAWISISTLYKKWPVKEGKYKNKNNREQKDGLSVKRRLKWAEWVCSKWEVANSVVLHTYHNRSGKKETDEKDQPPPKKNKSTSSRKWNDYTTFQNVFICSTNLVMNSETFI